MDVDVVARPPHLAQHLAVRHELPVVLEQVREEPEFGRREADLLAAKVCPVLVEIDDQVTMAEPARAIWRRGRGPAQRGFDSRGQLGEAQGLRDTGAVEGFRDQGPFGRRDAGTLIVDGHRKPCAATTCATM